MKNCNLKKKYEASMKTSIAKTVSGVTNQSNNCGKGTRCPPWTKPLINAIATIAFVDLTSHQRFHSCFRYVYIINKYVKKCNLKKKYEANIKNSIAKKFPL